MFEKFNPLNPEAKEKARVEKILEMKRNLVQNAKEKIEWVEDELLSVDDAASKEDDFPKSVDERREALLQEKEMMLLSISESEEEIKSYESEL